LLTVLSTVSSSVQGRTSTRSAGMTALTSYPCRTVVRGVAAGLALAVIGLSSMAPDASAAAGSDRLSPGDSLSGGASIVSGADRLVMQTDGNLVLYAGPGVALWASGTNNHPGSVAVMQGDGNLVVYAPGNVSVWGSGTNGRGASTLLLQSDGNLVLRGPGGVTWSTDTYKQSMAVNRFPVYGWGADQWGPLRSLWTRESNWNTTAKNPSSGAYGIPQALPASKMAVDGADYLTNPATQIHWGEDYIAGRYGTPANAWNHEVRYGWY